MLPEMVMAKVEGATQATLLSGLAGNSYTVGQVSATGNGLGTWLFLTPDGGGAVASQGAVALKLEGTTQMAQMSGLVGKSVTIGKAPTVVGGVGKWVVFYPKAAVAAKGIAGAAAAGVGAANVADSQVLMLKLEGTRFAAQVPYLTGKSFTVVKTTSVVGGTGKWLFLQPVGDAAAVTKDIVVLKVQHGASQLPWLVGKTFTVGKAPLVAGANAANYLVLHPATAVIGKTVAATSIVTAKGMTAARVVDGAAAQCLAPTMKTVALQTAAGGGGAVTAGAATVGKVAATGGAGAGVATGTIWNGTGMSLGLGLGLGVAGPLILGVVIAATGYGIYRLQKNAAENNIDDDDGIRESLA